MSIRIHTIQGQFAEATPENLAAMGLPADCQEGEFRVAWTANQFQATPRRSLAMLDALTSYEESFGGHPRRSDAVAAAAARFPVLVADVQASRHGAPAQKTP